MRIHTHVYEEDGWETGVVVAVAAGMIEGIPEESPIVQNCLIETISVLILA
jgi:hypothetical protein